MKITNAQLLSAYPAVNELVKEKLPARISFKVAKLALAVEKALDPVESTRAKILETGIKRDDKDEPLPVFDPSGKKVEGQVQLTDDGIKELTELFEIETEVDAEPLKLSEIENTSLEPTTIIGLGPLLVDE